MEFLTVIEMELKIFFGNFFSKLLGHFAVSRGKDPFLFLFYENLRFARRDLDSFCSLRISRYSAP